MKRIALITVICAFVTVPVRADLTVIGPGGGGSETNLDGVGGILDGLYGWDNLTRIDDRPLVGDQIWVDLNGGVSVRARYAGYRHRLGYSIDEVGGTGIVWLATDPIDPGETDSFDLVGDSTFVWALHVNNTGQDQFSREALNNNEDMMVTYRVNEFLDGSIPTKPTYVIGWADIRGGDHDFNDLVVEVSGAAPVPVPGAVLLGMLGLSVVGVKLRKRA